MFSFRTSPLPELLDRSLRDGRVAVMQGPAAWDIESGRYTSDIFKDRGNLVEVSDWDDPSALRGLNAVVVDVMDTGSRYGRDLLMVIDLMNTLASIESGDEYGYDLPSLYIVDHPNPAGRTVEGSMPVLSPDDSSVRAAHRHGLTIGELCHLHYSDIGARYALHIISASASANTHLVMPWAIPPQEDVAGLFTPQMYPGHALWSCTSISPGTGTCRPYELIGAPFISLADNQLPCPEGVSMRPCSWIPDSGPYAGVGCRGWQIILLPGVQYHSLLHTLQLMRHFSERYSEFRYEAGLWGMLSDPVAEAWLKGDISFDIVQESIKAEEQKWIRKAKRFCLYDDPPFRIK